MQQYVPIEDYERAQAQASWTMRALILNLATVVLLSFVTYRLWTDCRPSSFKVEATWVVPVKATATPALLLPGGHEYCALAQYERKINYLRDMTRMQFEHYVRLNPDQQSAFWRQVSDRVGCKF
jgi:hypothetical protein